MPYQVAAITDPASLAHVSSKQLLLLIRKRAPELAKRASEIKAKTHEDLQDLFAGLSPADEADPLLEDLHAIHQTCSNDNVEELLVGSGVSREKDQTIGDALAAAACDNRAAFESVCDHALVTAASTGATFTVFRARHTVGGSARLDAVHAETVQEESAAFFEAEGLGSHCRIRAYSEGQETGFLIDHAGPRRLTRLINENDEPEHRQYRPPRHDIFVLHQSTGHLRVLARSDKERAFYAQLAGRLLAKGASFFEPAEPYVLDAILTPQYRNTLSAIPDDDIERIALRELRLTGLDEFSTRHKLTSKDALVSLSESGLMVSAYAVTYASFSIVPRVRKGRRRLYRLEVWKGNKVKHNAPWSDAAIQHIIARLHLRRDGVQ